LGLARYRRAEFGRSSEKLAREAEQLELALEALESDQAERRATSPAVAAAVETAAEAHKPARRPLPEHLPREDRRHPAPCTCPGCGGALRKIADEVSETLDYVPGRFKVVRHRNIWRFLRSHVIPRQQTRRTANLYWLSWLGSVRTISGWPW
jgi:transposase